MFSQDCVVLENKKIAPGHYIMCVRSPKIAKAAKPGQFLQVLCADGHDPLLPRPFSFLKTTKTDVSFLYHAIGKGTRLLEQIKKGDQLRVLGPLGNGFSLGRSDQPGVIRKVKEILLVGGGVGIPPLYHLTREILKKNKWRSNDIHVFLGARSQSLLLCESDFKKLKIHLHLATDDGSKGHRGLVTEMVDRFLKSSLISTDSSLISACGPTPMLKAVQAIAKKFAVPCEISVEVPMACGFGVCLGCAVQVKDRYALACTEGPVFKGNELTW